MQLDTIIYNAIQADTDIMQAIAYTTPQGETKHALISTCFEVPPTGEDNTSLPNIIITDDGFQNQVGTKDTVWESNEDRVQVTVDVAASSPNEVKQLIKAVRRAIEAHICGLYQQDKSTPELENLSSDGLAWDWMKPCYYQKLTYQCITPSDTEDE